MRQRLKKLKVCSELKPSDPLWKYLDIAKFVAMLSKRSLWLNRIDRFVDKSEGRIPTDMMGLIKDAYNNLEKTEQIHQISSASEFEEYLRKNCFVDCWHKNTQQNMAMWQIYGKSEASIAIKTSIKKLEDSLDVDKLDKSLHDQTLSGFSFELRPVVYDVSESYLDAKKIKYHDCAFIKRREYVYEDEVRLGLCTYSSVRPTKYTPEGFLVCCDLNKMIEDIFIHPESALWFDEVIKSLLEEYGIKKSPKKGLCS